MLHRFLRFTFSCAIFCLLAAASFAQSTPHFDHIVIVAFENHSYESVVGNSSMPYFNSLVQNYGLATNFQADVHPSIGNYFLLTTGERITQEDSYNVRASVPNLVRSLSSAGLSWRSYAEGLPQAGYLGGDTGA